MIVNSKLVQLGKGAKIDKTAIVGYAPSRTTRKLLYGKLLVIGDGAQVRSGSVVYLGSIIGKNLETGHNVIIREENKIGDDVKIWSGTIVDYECTIGNNVKIHSNCYISQLTKIEDDAFIAPGVMIANEKYPTGKWDPGRVAGVTIRKSARVGMGSIILPGVSIGENSLVGAGAVVTEDVRAGEVVYGVPARSRSGGHSHNLNVQQ